MRIVYTLATLIAVSFITGCATTDQTVGSSGGRCGAIAYAAEVRGEEIARIGELLLSAAGKPVPPKPQRSMTTPQGKTYTCTGERSCIWHEQRVDGSSICVVVR